MFEDKDRFRQRLIRIVDKFREKGATSPEKAMTVQELGLPPRFEQAMHRRLGQIGIFVEVNGKYYLNEERLGQIQEQMAKAQTVEGDRGYNRSSSPTWVRYVGIFLMAPVGIAIVLVLFFFFYESPKAAYFPGEFLIIVLVVLLVLFVVRMFFWRSRRRYSQWP